jgi:hypothetical protein
LASKLEKTKIYEEKHAWKEMKRNKEIEKLALKHTIENSYNDRVGMLKQRI